MSKRVVSSGQHYIYFLKCSNPIYKYSIFPFCREIALEKKKMYFFICHFKVNPINWQIIAIIIPKYSFKASNVFFRGLKSWGDCNPVWTWFHRQTKISAEVKLLPRYIFNPQPMEQHGQKDKHLQTCKSVTKTASLPHAKDENLLCQFLV